MRKGRIWILWASLCFCVACSVDVPKEFVMADSAEVSIYPDYKDVVIPCNIAPMNFVVTTEGDGYIVSVQSADGKKMVRKGDARGRICFPEKEWHTLLQENIGADLTFDVYVNRNGWQKYPSFRMRVVGDSIDPYMTCRLIEPSYMSTGFIGIYQFNLETGESKAIATNTRFKREGQREDKGCMNCHSAQKNRQGNSLFHFRGKGGGMVLTYNGSTAIINTKVAGMYAPTTYPSWHPTLPLVAFSVNKTVQSFMSLSPGKIEVYDKKSDLVLYDAEKNELSYILKTKGKMETYPCWSPDGKWLYYCVTDSSVYDNAMLLKHLKYDLARIPFDESTQTWGEPEIILSASKMDSSATQVRVSPDGNYLLFSMSLFGAYPYTHKENDLYLMNLSDKSWRALSEVNSPEAEGYHDWSSSGRWILLSSRRVDGNYARPYFAYFDREGRAYKPFQIPHEDPCYDMDLMKNYNMTEFSLNEDGLSPLAFYDLLEKPVVDAKFIGEVEADSLDSYSGASVIQTNMK